MTIDRPRVSLVKPSTSDCVREFTPEHLCAEPEPISTKLEAPSVSVSVTATEESMTANADAGIKLRVQSLLVKAINDNQDLRRLFCIRSAKETVSIVRGRLTPSTSHLEYFQDVLIVLSKPDCTYRELFSTLDSIINNTDALAWFVRYRILLTKLETGETPSKEDLVGYHFTDEEPILFPALLHNFILNHTSRLYYREQKVNRRDVNPEIVSFFLNGLIITSISKKKGLSELHQLNPDVALLYRFGALSTDTTNRLEVFLSYRLKRTWSVVCLIASILLTVISVVVLVCSACALDGGWLLLSSFASCIFGTLTIFSGTCVYDCFGEVETARRELANHLEHSDVIYYHVNKGNLSALYTKSGQED